jgi:hypothetical protein
MTRSIVDAAGGVTGAGAGGVPGCTHDAARKRAAATRVIWFCMEKS